MEKYLIIRTRSASLLTDKQRDPNGISAEDISYYLMMTARGILFSSLPATTLAKIEKARMAAENKKTADS
jgi:hypothetical protein